MVSIFYLAIAKRILKIILRLSKNTIIFISAGKIEGDLWVTSHSRSRSGGNCASWEPCDTPIARELTREIIHR